MRSTDGGAFRLAGGAGSGLRPLLTTGGANSSSEGDSSNTGGDSEVPTEPDQISPLPTTAGSTSSSEG